MPFTVTAPAELKLAPDRTGTTTFTVTNLTGRPVRARLMPRGDRGAETFSFAVVGGAEIPMSVGSTITADVRVVVPPTAPAGQHLLILEVVAEDDTETVVGQSVAFSVGAPSVVPVRPRRKYHWLRIALIVLLSLFALIGLLVVGIIVLAVVSN
ncbi:hypothetical protein GCM10009841_06580 [Microlunatus panaciterrae]|uniref:MSP domain-containing protein n=1 Tax=Microlunatus panaciterrae TaxID=400768 RepID=A0ABS2RI67_9ACTN|nr:hypothetical protein [Microlunatus panaciterrae]MBM7798688.1 hypothetical protein [Microlunatus panaciterrae]